MRLQFVLFIIFLFLNSLQVGSKTQYNDGPYVFERDQHREVLWVCGGDIRSQTITLKVPQTVQACNQEAVLWSPQPDEVRSTEHTGSFKIAAVSDIHGQYDLFITLLKNNGILDEHGKWRFGNGHFIITGDVFDRGPQVTEALWFLYDLEKQAQRAGGKVHLLLGNHEVMVLNGDLRYLHSKYLETVKLTKLSYETLFATGSVLGDWLRSRPVLVKINGILFAHAGFHPALVHKNLAVSEINRLFKSNLIKAELKEPRQGIGEYLHKSDGPIWYRGYFKEGGVTTREIEGLLEHFNVTHIVVGHTTQEKVKSVHNGRIIAIDASMKSGLYGEMMFWEAGQFTRGTLSGEKIPLVEATKAALRPFQQHP